MPDGSLTIRKEVKGSWFTPFCPLTIFWGRHEPQHVQYWQFELAIAFEHYCLVHEQSAEWPNCLLCFEFGSWRSRWSTLRRGGISKERFWKVHWVGHNMLVKVCNPNQRMQWWVVGVTRIPGKNLLLYSAWLTTSSIRAWRWDIISDWESGSWDCKKKTEIELETPRTDKDRNCGRSSALHEFSVCTVILLNLWLDDQSGKSR